jgi:preprotein translocase subunit SecD
MRGNRRLAPLCLVPLLVVGCAAQGATTQRMLAHDGGIRLTLHAACLPDQPRCDVIQARDGALPILAHRLSDGLGLANTVVRPSGPDGVVVELPGVKDASQIVPLLTAPGQLAVLDTQGQEVPSGSSVHGRTCTSACQPGQYRVLFTSAQINPAAVSAATDPNSNRPAVYFGFAGPAKQQFADYTRGHIGQYLTVALDDTVIESAVIQGAIDGEGEIIGFQTVGDARRLAAYLKYGALPATLSVASDEQVTPSAR